MKVFFDNVSIKVGKQMKTLSKESLDDGLTEPKDSMLSLTSIGEKLKKTKKKWIPAVYYVFPAKDKSRVQPQANFKLQ